MDRDVTEQVTFEFNDDEALPLTRCVCGKKFRAWECILGVYPDMPDACPACGRYLYFSVEIRVYEVVE